MKITNTVLLLAVAGSLAACEKSAPDTANPGDATETPSTEAPEGDPLDAAGGEEEAAEEPAEGEAPAEGEEAAEE